MVSAGWLLIGRYHAPSTRLLGKPALELLELFGTGGKLIAISVLCLLIGEVTSSLVQALFLHASLAYLRRLKVGDLDRRPRGPRAVFRPLSSRAVARVRSRIRLDYQKHQDAVGSETTPRTEDHHEVDRITIEALREMLHMSPRLIVAKPELHVEFSRINAESEFRDAILLPLPVLAVAVCVNLAAPAWLESVLLAGVGVVDVYLFAQARKLFREAHSLIGHSVTDGTISSAAMGDRS